MTDFNLPSCAFNRPPAIAMASLFLHVQKNKIV
ncbi:hypothetical protein AMTRI_Chr12g269610 [Amborella trichopoda]